MTREPYPSELVPDAEFEKLLRSICARPGMFGVSTLSELCAYLEGFNHARSGGPLVGLHQWLVLRAGSGNNLHWRGLIEAELGVNKANPGIGKLGELLLEFIAYRRDNGLTKIYQRYALWLLEKDWYEGPLR
jgi:hypothetical protein